MATEGSHDLENGTTCEDKMEKGNQEKAEKPKSVGIFELFSFADKWDVLWIVLGITASVVAGAIFPILFIVFGSITTGFTDYQVIENETAKFGT